jgi:transcriptional regulator with XRE-family HTH domain
MNAFGAASRQARLAEGLKRLRLASGLTGDKLAAELKLSQSTISRIENGRQRVSVPQVHRWCVGTGASEERLAEMLTLAEDALVGPQSWEAVIETGSTNLQAETAQIEAAAALVCVYQPAGLPGLLQTPAYARRIFESDGPVPDLAERVLGRMERQRVLYDESKQLRFLIPETVLRWPFGPADEQVEQLDRLRTILDRPNVDLGLLPMVPNPVWRLTGFVIYDEAPEEAGVPLVHLETLTRPVDIIEADQVERYRRAFARLEEQAVHGRAARSLLGRVVRSFRLRPT